MFEFYLATPEFEEATRMTESAPLNTRILVELERDVVPNGVQMCQPSEYMKDIVLITALSSECMKDKHHSL